MTSILLFYLKCLQKNCNGGLVNDSSFCNKKSKIMCFLSLNSENGYNLPILPFHLGFLHRSGNKKIRY